MKIRFEMVFCGLALSLLAAGAARAQDLRVVNFSGVMNDYSPSTVTGGPWEMRGQWSAHVQRSGTATFTATLTMQTSDYGIMGATHVDPTDPTTRMSHTHYINITSATVSYDTSVCAAYDPATSTTGIVLTGPATITANGGPAPFASKGPSSLQICILGGTQVDFSNIEITFTGPATGHFGPQAIHGVVSDVSTK